MDLWIRSQDKTTLLKVDEINLFELESFCRLETPTCVLGDYKTKERALEILDEIQKYIADSFSQKEISQFFGANAKSKIVYEMPKE